jgi:hypothetical protein
VSLQDFVHSIAGTLAALLGAIAAFFVALKAFWDYRAAARAAAAQAGPPPPRSPLRALVLALLAGMILGAVLTLLAARLFFPPAVAVTQPKTDKDVRVELDPVGSARFNVTGTSRGVFGTAGRRIYLLVHPEAPEAAGWWIQPDVVLEQSGNWSGTGWIGSKSFPTAAGHRFVIFAVAAAEREPLPKDEAGVPWLRAPSLLDPVASSDLIHVHVRDVVPIAEKIAP